MTTILICESMDIMDESKVVIQQLKKVPNSLSIDMLRLDLLHPVISGNKWYKLRPNLEAAKNANFNTILTFGGAFSNHLIATAAAAAQSGFQSVGVVRGLDTETTLNPTLEACKQYGMKLHFVSREDYHKNKTEDFLATLQNLYGEIFVIPEGGANENGRSGAEDIGNMIPNCYSHVCVSVGSGTTVLGILRRLTIEKQVLGFAPMKKGKYLKEVISQYFLPKHLPNLQLFDQWHFGGFGHWKPELLDFMNQFYLSETIPLDMVYTAKMMFGVFALIQQNYFPEKSKILCIHTGGLQGNISIRSNLCY
ncbi:MAG: pyridoxal-phosphate dependent enzyme [Bacteroidetes bacterium]|nr:pyridoxal-phosphate dependent enzyme [Bacteroidota bacterium]MBS1741312.1 pyridoxal-phosphate dependent enzyme [Bacteroidota bacterium]